MQHNDTVWGDPYIFRPERWIEDPDIRKYMMIFGHGTRVCVRSLFYSHVKQH